jgi:hypothetical protein
LKPQSIMPANPWNYGNLWPTQFPKFRLVPIILQARNLRVMAIATP